MLVSLPRSAFRGALPWGLSLGLLTACKGDRVGLSAEDAGGAAGAAGATETAAPRGGGPSGGSTGGGGRASGSGGTGGQGGSQLGSGGTSSAVGLGGSPPDSVVTIPSLHASLVLEFGDELAAGAVTALAIDPNDNVVLAGHFGGEIDFGDGVRRSAYSGLGAGSLFVFKIDPQGDVLWSRVFPVATCCTIAEISIDPRGDVVLLGGVEGTSDFGDGLQQAFDQSDTFVAKVRGSDGRLVFSRRYGSTSSDWALGLTTDDSDYIYTAGVFGAPVSFADGPEVSFAPSLYVARFDPQGTFDWLEPFAPSEASSGFARMAFDGARSVLAAGNIYSAILFGDTQHAPQGGHSLGVLVEVDSSGEVLDATEVVDGGNLVDVFVDDFGVLVAGSLTRETLVGGLPATHWIQAGSPFVAALSSDTLEAGWVQTFESLEISAAFRIWGDTLERDRHGLVHVLLGVSTDVADTVRVVTLDAAGELLRVREIGGEARSFGMDSSGALWVAGGLRSSFDFGQGPMRGPIFVSKFEPEVLQ